MMEEVAHSEGTGTLTPPPMEPMQAQSGTTPTQQPALTTPPPQAAPYLTPPPTSAYTPQVSSYQPQTSAASVSYQQAGAPESSSIMLPDMPDYSQPQNQQADSSPGGMWGWIKSASQNTFVQSVVEKTKSGVGHVITTLDPGMQPYLLQGGDVSIVVASEKEVKWGAIRDAFQKVFGMAEVKGMPSQPSVAPQPVGYAAGLRGANDRITYLRRSGLIHEKQLCVAVESFVAELLPDKWFDIGCIVLEDPNHNINLELFTQAVPVPQEIISHIQSATPADYNLSWSGLSVTLGQAFQHHMPWIEPSDWHKTLTGQSRKAIIFDSALTLAGLYKEKLPKSAPGRAI